MDPAVWPLTPEWGEGGRRTAGPVPGGSTPQFWIRGRGQGRGTPHFWISRVEGGGGDIAKVDLVGKGDTPLK
jgi:hypothetical protein